MRKKLRRAVIAAVLVLVGGGVFLVGRTMLRQQADDVAVQQLEVLPGVSHHLQDFRRVQVKDGRKVWEVSAEDARFYETDAIAVVRKPMVAWYLEDGRRLGLSGDEGRVVLSDGSVQFVEMKGAIEVDLAELRIEVDEAVYDHENRRISAPGRVQIAGRYLDVSGAGMDLDIDGRRLTLAEHVEMTLQPSAFSPGGIRGGS